MARIVSMVVAGVGLVLVRAAARRARRRRSSSTRAGRCFFVQQRAGRDGRPFGLLKFRTMHPATEARSEWVLGQPATGSRRVGRWLRRFRLDELPQLVNVLRGEMNLIGPRPHPTSQPRRLHGATSPTTACAPPCARA